MSSPQLLAKVNFNGSVRAMRLQLGCTCGSLLALAVATTNVMAQGGSSQNLTEAQVKTAVQIEDRANTQSRDARAQGAVQEPALPRLADTPAGKRNKSVVPSVTPVGSIGTTPSAARVSTGQRAMVTRYDYATGVTTRTTVDLDTGAALHVRKDLNYPTPLAKEETEQALELARRTVPALDAIVKSARPEALNIVYMVPVNTDPSSPRYGHRLVILWVEQPARSSKTLVDLSTEEVEPNYR